MYTTVYRMQEVTHYGAQMLSNREILHREICMACGNVKREDKHILYDISYSANKRGQSGLDLIIQSDIIPGDIPDFHKVVSVDMSTLTDNIHNGRTFAFSILTAPYKSLKGKKYYIPNTEGRKEWVRQKWAKYGMDVSSVRETGGPFQVSFQHKKACGGSGHIDAWLYSGMVTVEDEEKMKEAHMNGIGPGKAYGLGLLKLMTIC